MNTFYHQNSDKPRGSNGGNEPQVFKKRPKKLHFEAPFTYHNFDGFMLDKQVILCYTCNSQNIESKALNRCAKTMHQYRKIKEYTIKAHIISSSSDGASDSGWGKNLLRVEVNGRTVYLEHNYNWSLQTGAEDKHSSSDEYKVVSVDKEPFGKTELPEAAQAFLEQFAGNEFQGNPVLKINQNSRGTFVEGVDGFTKLAPTPVLNPVL